MFVCFSVEHPNTGEYPEDFETSACLVASQKQDLWKSFSFHRIKRSIEWISRRKPFSTLLLFSSLPIASV